MKLQLNFDFNLKAQNIKYEAAIAKYLFQLKTLLFLVC